jgi:hypothetical protein
LPVTEVQQDDVLETVILGAFLDGVLRIWRNDGRPECRRVVDRQFLSKVLAKGFLARTSPEPNRFREVALLDERTSTLMLMERPISTGQDVSVGGMSIVTELCDLPSCDTTDWVEWGRWLGTVIVSAVERREFVVVERGGWEDTAEPRVLAGVLSAEDGEAVACIEAVPAPTTPPWATEGDTAGGSISASANAESLSVAGILAAQAVALWVRSPLEVVLTFAVAPADSAR